MGVELEWKFAASAAALARAEAESEAWRELRMETIYYDTPDRALGARRWTLRLRREGGVPVVCCKTPGPGRARGEWEWRGEDLREAVPQLIALGAPAALAELTAGRPLEPLCGARFTRRAALIRLEGAALELAADQGVLTGGGREQPFLELEVEHKSGDPDRTAAYAAALARRLGLTPEPRSKFQRAAALCTPETAPS